MIPKHIQNLILLAITVPIVVIIALYCLRITIDLYDLYYYFDHALLLSTGVLPYTGVQFDYPPLALVPMVIAILPALVPNSFQVFAVTFAALMLACNAGIAVCSYFIAFKVYQSVNTAYWAGILSTLGIASAYFVVTKFDAFPVFLMMAGIWFVLYERDKPTGYAFAVMGFFTKLFPAVIIPFGMFYNQNKTLVTGLICTSIVTAALVLFMWLDALNLLRLNSVYANTPVYLAGSGLSKYVFEYFAVVGLCYLLYLSYRNIKQTPHQFLTYITLSLMLVVFCMPYHSPQYILWYSPLLAILLASDTKAVLAYLTYQVVAFINFPIAFNWLWVNDHYLQVYTAMTLFTVEFALMIALGYFVVERYGKEVIT